MLAVALRASFANSTFWQKFVTHDISKVAAFDLGWVSPKKSVYALFAKTLRRLLSQYLIIVGRLFAIVCSSR